MRNTKDILFDINNWKSSAEYGATYELASIAEILLDIRDLLANPPEKIGGSTTNTSHE